MIELVGLIVVIGSVLGGFVAGSGPLAMLIVPAQYVVIGGTVVGTILISTPSSVVLTVRFARAFGRDSAGFGGGNPR